MKKIKKLAESLKNLIVAILEEIEKTQTEDLFIRQYKGGEKK